MAQEISYHEDFAGHFRLLSFATGSYLNSCRVCGKEFIGDKRAISCLACAINASEAKFTSANTVRAKPCADFVAHDRCIWQAADMYCEKSPCMSVPRMAPVA